MLKPILYVGCIALLSLTSCQNAPLPEQNLATIDRKSADTKAYAALLDEVTPKCTEDRATIAALTTQTVNTVNQKGKPITNREMLSELRDALKAQPGKQNCANLYVLVGMAVKGSK